MLRRDISIPSVVSVSNFRDFTIRPFCHPIILPLPLSYPPCCHPTTLLSSHHSHPLTLLLCHPTTIRSYPAIILAALHSTTKSSCHAHHQAIPPLPLSYYHAHHAYPYHQVALLSYSCHPTTCHSYATLRMTASRIWCSISGLLEDDGRKSMRHKDGTSKVFDMRL